MPAARRFHCDDSVAELKAMTQKCGKLYVGIDPGQTGAIAFLPDRAEIAPLVIDIPTVSGKVMSTIKGKRKEVTRTHYDYQKIVIILDPLIDFRDNVVILLERGQAMGKRPGHSGDGAKTSFSIGLGYGMWQLYFAAFALIWDEVSSASWKPKMDLRGKDKTASRRLASRLFPLASKYFALASDHNRAEAILLAEFLRRKQQGEVQR